MTVGAGTSLVGRDRELERLRAVVGEAVGGHGRVVVLDGEPGIGKTRLVAAACDAAAAAGFDVFVGACDDLVAAPFGPLVTALRVYDVDSDPERFAVATLLDQHDMAGGVGASGAAKPGLQFRIVEAFGALIERLAERGPLLLAVDDLQWADVSTLVALRSIARRIATLPVVLLAASRSGHDVAELHRVTDDLLRGGAVRLGLGPLDVASVERLVADVLQERPTETLLSAVRGASGNPLFVIEYARSAQAADPARVDVDAPEEFRLTVLRRLATLSPAAGDALRLAAVLGSSFAAADLAVVSTRSVVELAPVLHEAVVAAILEDGGDQLAFRHALVRDAIYEQTPAAVRADLHREVGRALAAAGADVLVVAHHLGLGAVVGDSEAVDWLRRAARDAAPRSPSTAVALLQRAGDLLGPAARERDAVLAELAVALAWSGRLADAEALSIEVLERRPDPEVAGALRCGLVYALTWQGKPAAALRHTEVGPDEQLGERDAALLLAEAAVASLFAFEIKAAGELATKAIAAAERVGHDVALCHALTAQSWVSIFTGRRDAVAIARRAVAIADRTESSEAHLAHPRFFLGGIPLLGLDRLDEAEEMLRSGLRIAESLGLAWSFPLYHAFLGSRAYIAGEWDVAVAECETALAVADEVGLHIGTIAATSGWLAAVQVHRDDLEGAERTIANAMGRLAETGPQLGMGVFNWAKALLLEARGKTDEALALLRLGWELYMAGGPVADSWSSGLLLRLRLATGDREGARAMLGPTSTVADETMTPYARGGLLHSRGLVEADVDLLLAAVELIRQSPRPYELALACEDAATALAAAGRMEEAVPLWDEAIGIYERLAADRDVARVGAQLRAHGVRRGVRRPHARATNGWESLTAMEHKVVALVAQRLSNPDVAERLFISRHTVESHLKNIYRKLGLTSRLELAALAVRHAEGGVGT